LTDYIGYLAGLDYRLWTKTGPDGYGQTIICCNHFEWMPEKEKKWPAKLESLNEMGNTAGVIQAGFIFFP
jgi:hypothetical protein